MNEDAELLSRYAEEKSEAAFAELVRRQVNFVHAAALRRVGGDAQLAQEVTQQVFTALARDAKVLARHPVLCGWMFTATRRIAAQAVRTETRRRAREQAAFIMNEINPTGAPQPDWERLRPELDAVLDQLGERDREAVLLRFFEGNSFGEIGGRLRLSENAARMCVERALDKMHAALASRGVSSTTAALGLALTAQAASVAPVGLAASVTGVALAGGGAVAAGLGTWATLMSMTKLQIGISSALVVAGATGLVMEARSTAELRETASALRADNQQIAGLRASNLQLARTAAEVAGWSGDDADLKKLSDEAAELAARMRTVVRAEALAATANDARPTPQLNRQPRAMSQIRPQYPAALREAGITGTVMVDFIVDAKGDVRNAYVAKKQASGAEATVMVMERFVVAASGQARVGAEAESAQRELEAAALAAVSQWKFEAGQHGGRNVNTHMQTPIQFTLGDGSGAPGSTAAKPSP
jgi:RNA polymerase sigma factor (sigma-70 family)